MSWNPNILVFACNWCSYAGADTAGVSRIQHQPHFRTIRVIARVPGHPICSSFSKRPPTLSSIILLFSSKCSRVAAA